MYHEADGFKGRKADVLRWLTLHQAAWPERPPTTAELADWILAVLDETQFASWGDRVLYVRRGMSDLHKARLVENSLPRLCRSTKRRCETWRVAKKGFDSGAK